MEMKEPDVEWSLLVLQRERNEAFDELYKFRKFLRDIAYNYDCDTGVDGVHAPYCRSCCARELLEEVE
jgi:hypothetical protein